MHIIPAQTRWRGLSSPRRTGEAQDAGCIVGCTMRFVFVGANCIRPRPSGTPSGVPPPHEWGG